MNQEQIAKVLVEHAFHMITPVDLDEVNGEWQVECNCDSAPIKGPSFLGAEAAFAAHQAAMLAPLFAAAQAEAFEQGQKSGMRHADRFHAAAKIGRLDLPGPISPNPYRTT